MGGRQLRIGQLAALAGVSVDTVRFYERRGLLPRARRTRSGYRVFDEASIERLRLVRALAELHVPLHEIGEMVRALARPDADCADERPRLAATLERTEAKIEALVAVRGKLREALARCDAGACELSSRARAGRG